MHPVQPLRPISALAASVTVACKEWSVVCDALLTGEQVVLVRKGGIHEPRRGFAMEHTAFWLYPNAEHQRADHLSPEWQSRLGDAPPAPAESGWVTVPGLCLVTDVLVPVEQERMRELEPLTCWTRPFFEARLAYKPERPLYVAIVRAYRLPEPIVLPYHKSYAGCRTWVPLRDAMPAALAAQLQPALDAAAFARAREAALAAIGPVAAQVVSEAADAASAGKLLAEAMA